MEIALNYWTLSAGILSGLLIFVHIFGGGPEIHNPMLESDLPQSIKSVWSVVWHAITLLLILGTIVLVYAALYPGQINSAVVLICAMYFGFALLFVAYGIVQLGSVIIMPQWIAFGLIALLAGIGLRGNGVIMLG